MIAVGAGASQLKRDPLDSMTPFRLNVAALFFQLLGTFFLLLDSIRVSIRLPREGIRLGGPPEVDSWIYHWASSVGFGSLFIGFVLCGFALWLSRTKNSSTLQTVTPTRVPQPLPRPQPSPSTAEKLYELLRAKIVHEDLWVQQRVSWLLGSNAFLFAAFGVLLTIQEKETSESILLLRKGLLYIVPVMGFFVSVLVFAGIAGAGLAMKNIRAEWEHLTTEAERGNLPDLRSTGAALQFGRAASWGLCGFVALAWVAILLFLRWAFTC